MAGAIDPINYGINQLDQIHNQIGQHSKTLEETFYDLVDVPFDGQKNHFDSYLFPNEKSPCEVTRHLDLVEKAGIYVSTGTERSFFDLALSRPDKCLGLVVRDVNPNVKAYVDFNVMLLRISNDINEYVFLSSDPRHEWDISQDEELLKVRLEIIKLKIKESSIAEPVKSYYLKNLESYAKVYFFVSKSWKAEESFNGAKYFQDEEMFKRLKNYASSGRIIATVGDINDLAFLNMWHEPVVLVDISNIYDYTFIDWDGLHDFHPRVLWTNLNHIKVFYRSFTYQPLDPSKKEELKTLITLACERIRAKIQNDEITPYTLRCNLRHKIKKEGAWQSPFNKMPSVFYSQRTLDKLKGFLDLKA